MIRKEFRQMGRDHRTLAMMIVMPVVLLVVFGYAASFDTSSVPTVVGGSAAESVAGQLPALFAIGEVDASVDRNEGIGLLRRGEAVVVLIADPAGGSALIDGSELFSAREAVGVLTAAQIPGLTIEVLFNPELDTSAILVPGLGGLILLFIGTVITSLGVVRERQAGTLEQLAVMPLRPRDVFVGKVAPYFLVASIDLAVVLVVGSVLFGVPFEGSVATMLLGSVLFLFVTLGIGVLISGVSENQGQAVQLALMTLLPQVLLSGIIFPLASMAAGVRWLGYLLPLTYFNQVAKGVMVKGAPISSLQVPLVVLAVMGGIVFALAVLRFRGDLASARADLDDGAMARASV